MKIIFPAEPFSNNIEQHYQLEADAAQAVGFNYSLINFEALVDDQCVLAAIAKIPARQPGLAIYRGWMLKPSDYQLLYRALKQRNVTLINSPDQYQHCHYLPESLAIIEPYTPRTVYLEFNQSYSLDRVFELLKPFGNSALILKDYVKSRKHEWQDACFISAANDHNEVTRVVNNFITRQGEDLAGGLVFREYVELQPLTTHPKSGMPLTKEFRLFILDGDLLMANEYWAEGDYQGLKPPIDQFLEIARQVQSRFFTIDIAQRKDGQWIIIELGDGQVAGLPDNCDVNYFYQQLHSRIR